MSVKLDYDCLRAVMLYVEKNQVFEIVQDFLGDGETSRLKPLSAKQMEIENDLARFYKPDIIFYSCQQALLSELLVGECRSRDMLVVYDITPKGHEFLAALKNPTVWDQVKSSANKLGNVSLPILIKLGADIMMRLAFPPTPGG